MAYSYSTGVGDGVTRSFVISLEGQDEGYISEDSIFVYVDGADAPFSFLSSNTIELESAPNDGAEVLIRRVVDKDLPYTDFSRGNNFGQDAINNSFLQQLYALQEILDGFFPEGYTVQGAVDFIKGLTSQAPDPNEPSSVVTFGSGDDRYVNLTGDAMEGSLNMESYPLFVRIAVDGNEPARKDQLDEEVSKRESEDASIRADYQGADANLQAQLTGKVPLEASAFSPISWHDKVIENSIVIPENKNAWSFGPDMTIIEGQSVTISDGSHWTIAEGKTFDEGTIENYDGGEL